MTPLSPLQVIPAISSRIVHKPNTSEVRQPPLNLPSVTRSVAHESKSFKNRKLLDLANFQPAT